MACFWRSTCKLICSWPMLLKCRLKPARRHSPPGGRRITNRSGRIPTANWIDKAPFPVLLVPAEPQPRELRKIVFATDLSAGDVDIIHSLASLARPFNAEILIAHVTDEKYDTAAHQQRVNEFLSEVTGKANYGQIYYRHIKSMDFDHGLDWLSERGMINMLSMVHRPHPVWERLIKGSHTQKLAKHIHIPLLVFPPDAHSVCF